MSRRPVVWLQQACTHPVQLHGLCGICGADLTSYAPKASPIVIASEADRETGMTTYRYLPNHKPGRQDMVDSKCRTMQWASPSPTTSVLLALSILDAAER